jgi:hypothetical protein
MIAMEGACKDPAVKAGQQAGVEEIGDALKDLGFSLSESP